VSRSCLRAVSLCARHRALQRACGDGSRERQNAVDEDHWEVDAIAPLELLLAVDRHAPEVESEPGRLTLEHGQRVSAEPAARPLEEHDLDAASRRR
jgi:hypothetical protein